MKYRIKQTQHTGTLLLAALGSLDTYQVPCLYTRLPYDICQVKILKIPIKIKSGSSIPNYTVPD